MQLTGMLGEGVTVNHDLINMTPLIHESDGIHIDMDHLKKGEVK